MLRIYSVYGDDHNCAPILACLVVFMCHELLGFGIDLPLGEISMPPIIPEVAESESGKAVVKIGPHLSDVLSLSSLFDATGIGQRILPNLVCGLPLSLTIHSYIYDTQAHFARNPREIGRPTSQIEFVPLYCLECHHILPFWLRLLVLLGHMYPLGCQSSPAVIVCV